VSAETIYVSESGVWKLGSFESARQFDQLTTEFLHTCRSFMSVSKQVSSSVCVLVQCLVSNACMLARMHTHAHTHARTHAQLTK